MDNDIVSQIRIRGKIYFLRKQLNIEYTSNEEDSFTCQIQKLNLSTAFYDNPHDAQAEIYDKFDWFYCLVNNIERPDLKGSSLDPKAKGLGEVINDMVYNVMQVERMDVDGSYSAGLRINELGVNDESTELILNTVKYIKEAKNPPTIKELVILKQEVSNLLIL
jgi:hypothetical protein